MALEQIRSIEDLIKILIPRMPYEAKAISTQTRGWKIINFAAPFKSKPVVICSLEGDVTAWYTLPTFPKFAIPKISLPAISIDVPYWEMHIPTADDFVNIVKNFFGDWGVFNWMRDAISWALGNFEYWIWDKLFRPRGLEELNERVLKPIRNSLNDFVAKIYSFRDSLQESLNTMTNYTNKSIEDAEKAVGEGINRLWSMLGQEAGRIFLPAKTRNVTSTSFEVYVPGACVIHYVAFETKIL